MKILILGKNGQIARRLGMILPKIAEIKSLDRQELAFEDLSQIQRIIIEYKPNIIINAAAYTNVDKAENQPEQSFLINTTAVEAITLAANTINALLIHYSSDYVFDGNLGKPYKETDTINPLNIYGKSKAAADLHIQKYCRQYIILRVSAVFDSYGHNFPKTILNLAKERDTLKVINDQFIVPTSAMFIAEATLNIIQSIISKNSNIQELYNLSPKGGAISWHEFAKVIIQSALNVNHQLKCLPQNVLPISTEEYGQLAKRPHFSELSTNKLQETLGFQLLLWNKYIKYFLKEMKY